MPKKTLNILAAAAIAALAGVASLSGAQAMPIALPGAGLAAHDIHSGEAVSPGSSLVQEVHWRGPRWHRGYRRGWHGRHWHRGWR